MTVLAPPIRVAPSPNHEARPAGMSVDTLLVSCIAPPDPVARLCDAVGRRSPHYVVAEDGSVWRLVEEERQAWHAGAGMWRGQGALDGRSIGVAVVHPGDGPFPALQMAALCDLCLGILSRHEIPARNVAGQGDVAPDRAETPGVAFDWRGLAANGVGLWPGPDGAPVADVPGALARIGYRGDLPLPVLLRAFQRRWQPEAVTGEADDATRRRLGAVLAAIAASGSAPHSE